MHTEAYYFYLIEEDSYKKLNKEREIICIISTKCLSYITNNVYTISGNEREIHSFHEFRNL